MFNAFCDRVKHIFLQTELEVESGDESWAFLLVLKTFKAFISFDLYSFSFVLRNKKQMCSCCVVAVR